MFSTDSLLSVAGGGVLLAIVAFVLKAWLPGRRSRNDQARPRPLGPLEDAARTAQSEAAKKREEADDAAREAIANRPVTDDPVADLRDRLDR